MVFNTHPGRHRYPGFTLIELLVVISIIVLLISILLPALSEAKKAALRILCANHQRQLGIGFSSYAHDFSSVIGNQPMSGAEAITPEFLYVGHSGGGWAPVTSGIGLLYQLDYVTTFEVLVCPSLPQHDNYIDYALHILGWVPGVSPSSNLEGAYIGRGPVADGILQWPGAAPGLAVLADGGNREDFVWHETGRNALYYDGHVNWYLDMNNSIDFGTASFRTSGAISIFDLGIIHFWQTLDSF